MGKLPVFLPLLLGVGFAAPLIAQGMTAVGLGIGAAWGLYAVLRGRWN